MVVKLGENLQRNAELAERAKRTETLLRREVGDRIDARWDLLTDKNDRPWMMQLQLSDPTRGQSGAVIRPEFFDDPAELERSVTEAKKSLGRLGEWKQEIDQLYASIRSWCASYAPELQIKEVPLPIKDQNGNDTGAYHLTALRLSKNGNTVEVHPVTPFIVAADGAVDLLGEWHEESLILSKYDGGWVWANTKPLPKFEPLTGELFVRLVRECME